MHTVPRLPSLGLLALLLAGSAEAQTSGDLFYTRYQTSSTDAFRVKKVTFTYDGSSLQLGPRIGIARSLGADGLVFSPRGTLLIAGQSNRQVCEIDATTGANLGCSTGTSADIYHLTMDPDNARLWTSNQPGRLLFEVPVVPSLGTPIVHSLANGAVLTQVVFTPNGVFYTSSAPNGLNGTFGTLDMATWTASPKLTGVDGMHGVTFDRHTGHVIAFGARFITQITPDPNMPTIVARLDVNSLPSLPNITAPIDQGTTNGAGLLFAAVNGSAPGGGHLIFLDITRSRSVAMPDFSATPTLDTFVDDVAPLSGAGCSAPARATAYGAGWPGTNGIPSLTSTLPYLRQTATLGLGNSSPAAAAACLIVGSRQTDLPTNFGGRMLVDAIALEVGFNLPASGTTFGYFVPSAACGIRVFAQMVQLDAGASHGVAFTPGLSIVFGN